MDVKFNNFCSLKETTEKMNKQDTDREKYSYNIYLSKDSYPRYIRTQNLNNKKIVQ